MATRLIDRSFAALAVVIAVFATSTGSTVEAASPGDDWAKGQRADSSSELRGWLDLFESARDQGPALTPLLPQETILSISTHLSPETARLLLERLSDPRTLRRFGIDRPTVQQLLEGLKLATPLLDEIEPHVQIVFARPSFSDRQPQPEVKLPAAALVFRPRDARRAKRTLLSAYLLAMQQANETARSEGRPALRMESQRRGDGFFAAASFKRPAATNPELEGLVDFNLSPSIAVVGERMMLASNRGLILELVDLASAEERGIVAKESLRIDVGPVAACHLTADNLPAAFSELNLRGHVQLLDRSLEAMHAGVQWTFARLPQPRLALRFKSGLPLWLVRRGG